MLGSLLLSGFLFVEPTLANGQTPPSCTAAEQDCWAEQAWIEPPKSLRPLVRWWWPGGWVTESGISEELALLERLGFGGVEIQPFAFGLLEVPAVTAAVHTVGTPPFFASIDYAIAQARQRDMQVDLTISSGWGVGGLLGCDDCGTHQLLMAAFDIEGPARFDRTLPRPEGAPYDDNLVGQLLGLAGDFDPALELVAVLAGRLRNPEEQEPDSPASLEAEILDFTSRIRDGRLSAFVPAGRFRIFAIYRNRTNTRLAGAAYAGDPSSFRTIDHLDTRGLQAFRRSYFDPLVTALEQSPDHYFVDSFEFLADLPWTPSFLADFAASRGYDLTPYLPLLFSQGGDHSFKGHTPPRASIAGIDERVREDYVDVRAELFRSRFLEPLLEAVHAAGARLRLQALGGYGDYLDTFALADVPEAEDFGLDGAFEFLKLASSAAHVMGNRRASNETFVRGLQGPRGSVGLRAADYHRLAGRAFASGINQLVYHGRAYPFIQPSGKQWYPFEHLNITTRLDQTNPVWPQLPHLNATFARLAYVMTRGRPSAQVAWLVTEIRPRELDSVEDQEGSQKDYEPYREISPVSRVLRHHAVSFDRVSRSQLASSGHVCDGRVCIGSGHYELVLVDHAAMASPEWLIPLRDFAAAGVPVVFLGAVPARARGLAQAEANDALVRDVMAQLEQMPGYRALAGPQELGNLLEQVLRDRLIRPDDPATWPFATAERELGSEDVLLVFNGNESAQVASFQVLRPGVREVVVLDPEDAHTGQRIEIGQDRRIRLTIPASRSRVLRLLRHLPPNNDPRER